MNFTVLQDNVACGWERGCETGKEFKFTLTTNALLLDEKVTQYLNDQNIKMSNGTILETHSLKCDLAWKRLDCAIF